MSLYNITWLMFIHMCTYTPNLTILILMSNLLNCLFLSMSCVLCTKFAIILWIATISNLAEIFTFCALKKAIYLENCALNFYETNVI